MVSGKSVVVALGIVGPVRALGTVPGSCAAIGTVVGGFLTDFYAMVAEWADRAECIVAAWPDDPSRAQPDLDQLRRIVARAAWSE
jgi:hypothetical protein